MHTTFTNIKYIFYAGVRQQICWRTPCSIVKGTSQLKIMRTLDGSICQVHFKQQNNCTRALFTPKSPLQGDRDDHFLLEFAP